MAQSRYLGTLAMVALVVVSSSAANILALATAASPHVAGNTSVSGTTTNLSANETAKLWSLDADEYDETTIANRSGTDALLHGTDYVWTKPPQTPHAWTQANFRQFALNFSTDRNTSIHPPHADRRDDLDAGGIEDAHASLVGVTPATRTYVNDSTTKTYLGTDGRVLGLVDYRVETPTDEMDESDGQTVNWTLESHEISRVCVLQGVADAKADCTPAGTRIASGDGTHTPNLSYDALEFAGRDTSVTLVAELEAQFNKTVRTRETWTEEVCREIETPNGTKTECEEVRRTRWETTVSHPTSRVTVTDSLQEVTFYRLQTAVQYARFPSGDMGVVVQSSHRWAGLHVSDGGRVTTPWRFYAARNTQWDQLATTTEDETTTRESPLRPARTYAFPADTAPRGLTDENAGSLVVETVLRGEQYATPAEALPDAVDVAVVAESYTTTTAMAFRYSEFAPAVDVSGLVPSASGSQLNVSASNGVVTVRRTTVSATVVDSNYSHATVRATLRDAETGQPIDLRGRDGYVTVQDHRVNTNASGVVLVTVPKRGAFSVRYQPTEWWDDSPAYASTRTRVHAQSGFFSVNRQARLWTRIVTHLFPFAFALYLLDKLPGVNAWPPWR